MAVTLREIAEEDNGMRSPVSIEDKHAVFCQYCRAELVSFYVDLECDMTVMLLERLAITRKVAQDHDCPERRARREAA